MLTNFDFSSGCSFYDFALQHPKISPAPRILVLVVVLAIADNLVAALGLHPLPLRRLVVPTHLGLANGAIDLRAVVAWLLLSAQPAPEGRKKARGGY